MLPDSSASTVISEAFDYDTVFFFLSLYFLPPCQFVLLPSKSTLSQRRLEFYTGFQGRCWVFEVFSSFGPATVATPLRRQHKVRARMAPERFAEVGPCSTETAPQRSGSRVARSTVPTVMCPGVVPVSDVRPYAKGEARSAVTLVRGHPSDGAVVIQDTVEVRPSNLVLEGNYLRHSYCRNCQVRRNKCQHRRLAPDGAVYGSRPH